MIDQVKGTTIEEKIDIEKVETEKIQKKQSTRKIAYIAVTETGKQLALNLQKLMGEGEVYVTQKLTGPDTYSIEGALGTFMKQLFKQYDYLICIMATGIVVRTIAPYVASKFKDPAVIVLDEKGHYVISLLSGHMGGANEMTRKLSQLIQAEPVITTATDVHEKAALDCILKDLNAYTQNVRESVKAVNYGLVSGEQIGLYIKGGYEVDERGLICLNGLQEELLKKKLEELDKVIYISHEAETDFSHPHLIKVVPRRLVLGVGCKKNTSVVRMLEAFEAYMQRQGLDPYSVALVGSIELKKDELAIQALARRLEVPFQVVTEEEIIEVEHLFEGSDFVKRSVGVSCVAEPAAYLLGTGQVISGKEKDVGMTFALGIAKS